MPVVLADSQSTLPQAQASELAADPSVIEQCVNLLHSVLADCLAVHASGAGRLAIHTAASTGFRVGSRSV